MHLMVHHFHPARLPLTHLHDDKRPDQELEGRDTYKVQSDDMPNLTNCYIYIPLSPP